MESENVIIKDEFGQEIPSKKRIIFATLAALGGSLIGMALWLALAAVNWVASIAALTVCFFANKFYNLAKGPQTKIKFWIILVITIVVLIFSEYLGLYIQLVVAKIPNVTFANTLKVVFSNFGLFAWDIVIFVLFSIMGTASTLVQIYKQVNVKDKVNVKSTNFNSEANDDYEAKFKEFEESGKDKFDDN